MNWLENWLLPPKCVLTEQPAKTRDLTDDIVQSWSAPKEVCPQCCEHSHDSSLCGACIVQPPAFNRTQVGFYFADELSDLVHALKYGNQIAHSRLLGELFAETIDKKDVEAIVAVPLHLTRWRDRGFNQSQLIAETVSQMLNVPLISKGVNRVKQTPSQTGLTAKQRLANLKSAFEVDATAFEPFRSIALLDDVITTGATMNSLAQTIKQKTDIENIEAWAIAKTK